MLGIAHVERNGHHYVDGFEGQAATSRERAAFVKVHGDLYTEHGDNAHVAIRDGALSLRSLRCAGFATATRPDIRMMSPLRRPGGVAVRPPIKGAKIKAE